MHCVDGLLTGPVLVRGVVDLHFQVNDLLLLVRSFRGLIWSSRSTQTLGAPGEWQFIGTMMVPHTRSIR